MPSTITAMDMTTGTMTMTRMGCIIMRMGRAYRTMPAILKATGWEVEATMARV